MNCTKPALICALGYAVAALLPLQAQTTNPGKGNGNAVPPVLSTPAPLLATKPGELTDSEAKALFKQRDDLRAQLKGEFIDALNRAHKAKDDAERRSIMEAVFSAQKDRRELEAKLNLQLVDADKKRKEDERKKRLGAAGHN